MVRYPQGKTAINMGSRERLEEQKLRKKFSIWSVLSKNDDFANAQLCGLGPALCPNLTMSQFSHLQEGNIQSTYFVGVS